MATSSALVLRAIWSGLRPSHHEAEWLKRLEVAPALLDDPEARVDFALVLRGWQLAAEISGDDSFGAHFGERLSMGAFDVVDYAARSCANLGEAIARLVRYQRLLHDAVHVALEVSDDEARLSHTMEGASGSGARQAAEAALTSYVVRMRALTGAEVTPREVGFAHSAPLDYRELQRVFHAPLRFDAPVDQLVLAAHDLKLPLSGADAGLRKILERQAEAMLERLPNLEGGLVPEAARLLMRMVGDGEPRLADAAQRLGVSPRALQRRLADEGESFQSLVDRVRRELALRYLRETQLPVSDIAFLVGFSEASAFNRAFRRWTGGSPSEHRGP